MSKKILLIGGGGHCKSVLDSLLERKEYVEIGIIDKKENLGNLVMDIPIIGSDEDLPSLLRNGYQYAFVTIGSIGNPTLRTKLYKLLVELGYEVPIIIDNSAVISKHAQIEEGVFIGKQCVINAGAIVQKGSIINSGAIVEHDCIIGAFSHIAPGAVLGGGVELGEQTHVGSNATIKQQVHVGSKVIIGMGSVVLKNISSKTMAYGNPCREVKRL